MKEHERREYLKSLDQREREGGEEDRGRQKEKHRQHPKVNAPVKGMKSGRCMDGKID